MIGAEVELPGFKEFLSELEDGEVAKDFLMHIVGLGYTIDELPSGVDIRTLQDPDACALAKQYWTVFFLTEFPDYGELYQ
jgi:hypothetical protein